MTTSSAALALLCLVAIGFLDLVFKLYAVQPRSRGVLVFGIGCVWATLQFAHMSYSGVAPQFDQVTLFYGALAAVFVTVSNILLLESLGHLPISMASTIYRLNTIPLVILAFLFLREDIGFVKGTGIVAGLFTVVLLYQPDKENQKPNHHLTLFMCVITAASCIRALYGIFTKVGVNNGGDPNTMMLLAAIAWCVGGLTYAFLRENQLALTNTKLTFIAVAGVLVFGIVWLLTTALILGDASIVVPITNMGFVAAFIFSVVLKLENLTPQKGFAIGSAIVSIVLLTSVA